MSNTAKWVIGIALFFVFIGALFIISIVSLIFSEPEDESAGTGGERVAVRSRRRPALAGSGRVLGTVPSLAKGSPGLFQDLDSNAQNVRISFAHSFWILDFGLAPKVQSIEWRVSRRSLPRCSSLTSECRRSRGHERQSKIQDFKSFLVRNS